MAHNISWEYTNVVYLLSHSKHSALTLIIQIIMVHCEYIGSCSSYFLIHTTQIFIGIDTFYGTLIKSQSERVNLAETHTFRFNVVYNH